MGFVYDFLRSSFCLWPLFGLFLETQIGQKNSLCIGFTLRILND